MAMNIDGLFEQAYRRSAMQRTSDEPRPDLRPVEGGAADEELALLAKALGHPARVRIARLLRSVGDMTCAELVEALQLAQSTVSEHLRVLREAGLVTLGTSGAARGPYRIDVHQVRRLKALTGSL